MDVTYNEEVYYKFLFNKQLKDKNPERDYKKFRNDYEKLYQCYVLYENKWWDLIHINSSIKFIFNLK